MKGHFRERKWVALFIAVLLAQAPLFLQSCGGGGFDTPAGVTGGQSVSSLLSPQQLKSWIDNGYKDERGYRVVILDTSFPPNARTDYLAGHIPGTFYVDFSNELVKTRSDGPMMVSLMVSDGPQMDALVQKFGIDKNTVVVFTGHHMYWMTRAYWTFRYWGFPQDRLFVLNGKATTDKSVWKAAGYELTTVEPPLPVPSTFSVSSMSGNIDAVRAPLEEMLKIAQSIVPNTIILDTRAETEWNAVVSATFSRAFEYRFNNSVWRPWELELAGTNVGDPYSVISLAGSGSHVLKTPDQLLTEYTALGLANKTAYST
ncbi:MAG: rhodanese-like domain-containing protein [Nitrospirae bacterium]|nr:rhodanese-like domain-containing protein [Nitrospirota bacterium]